MALIDDIIRWVEASPLEGGTTVVLRQADLRTPLTDAFFARVAQTAELRIAQAERTRTATGVQIRGRGTLHTYANLDPLVVSFSSGEHGVACTVEGTLPGANLKLPLVTWVKVRRAGLAVALLPPFGAVQWRFTAELAVSDARPGVIPISISPVSPSVWQFELAGKVSEEVTAPELIQLLSGSALKSFLPQALVDTLEGLVIIDLVATLDLERKRIEDFSVGLSVKSGWRDIVPGFSLAPGLELILSLTDPTVPALHRTSATVRGTLLIGGASPTRIPVFAQAVASAQPTNWLIGLDPDPAKYDPAVGGVKLPTLADLFALVSPDAANALPSGLRDAPAIVVSRLLVGFTTSPARVQSLAFAANTASPWTVVDGFLVIESLALDLDVVRLTTDEPLQVGGSVAGVFAVSTTAWISLRVAKDPATADWTLTGGLAPGQTFNLTELVATLLAGFVALPPKAPAIVFDEVSATAIPGKSLSFTAASHTPWPLLKDLSVDAFTLQVDYVSGQPTGTFTGSLATRLTIAKVPIDVRAALDTSGQTGWQFEGRTARDAPIHIGDLIDDLGSRFGVRVPDPVKSLTLRNLRLGFRGGAGTDAAPTAFSFGCEGHFQIAGVTLDALVAIDLTRAGEHYNRHAGGTLTIQTASGVTVDLTVSFSDSDSDTSMSVDWTSSPGEALTVEDIAAAFQFGDHPDIPDDLKTVGLARLTFAYDFTKKELAVALTISAGAHPSLGQALFVRATLGTGVNVYALGLTINTDVRLADLPLVGHMVPDGANLGIKRVSAWVLKDADQAPLADLNALVKGAGLTPLSAGDVKSRVVLAGDLLLGAGREVHLSLPLGGAKPAPGPVARGRVVPVRAALRAAPDAATKSDSAGMSWSDVHSQFGPFQLNRIGAGYENGELRFGLDAGLSLGPIALGMDGLSVSSPLTAFKPRFAIDGLSVDIRRGGLEVAGGFRRVRDGERDAYYGQVVVQAARFGLNAIGGYTPASGEHPASFFLYARLAAPLGGPPFLFVTGLAAGFGVNSALALPTIDTLAGYPLLPRNAKAQGGSASDTISTVIQDLREKKVFIDEPGQYWIALGISFTSFEMIDAFALATVEFGVDLQIALIGSCAMTFPKGTSIAYIEIDIVASCTPATGLLAVAGVLSPASYLYGDFVHLTGGFAFYTWFGGPHKGDFVVSLGGYYPGFTKPDFYPAVPRLAVQFALGRLHVTGEAYFALTPAMMMAGLAMRADWDGGRVRAWLDVSLDILLAWAPFHYEARAYLSIGCSVDIGLLTINLHVGAEMEIWGPPFGGAVTVDLDIVSFTIAFGRERTEPAPVGWATFRSSFLPSERGTPTPAPGPRRFTRLARQLAAAAGDPAPQHVIKGSVEAGLLGSNTGGVDWIVDPNHFSIVAISALPANHAEWGGDPGAIPLLNAVARWRSHAPRDDNAPYLDLPASTAPFSEHEGLVWNPTINLKPMKRDTVSSCLTVRVTRHGEDAPCNAVAVAPVLEDVPAALYGPTADGGANAPRTVARALVGFQITPIPRRPAQMSDVRLGNLLFEPGYGTGFAERAPTSDERYQVRRTPSAPGARELDIEVSGAHEARLGNHEFVLEALGNDWVAGQRAAILNDLVAAGFATRAANEVDVTAFTTHTALTDWPAVARLGERLAA